MIYIYNFIFMIFNFIIFERIKKIKKYYRIFLTIYFIFIFGQRWNAGVDFQGYLLYYLIKFKTEFGYRIIQDFIYDKNLYYGLLIFLTFSFTTIISVKFFSRFCKTNISYLVFFMSEYFIMSLNPIRTYLAIQFFLITFWFLYFEHKKIKSLIFFVLGTLFHKSIVMVSIFLLCLKKLKINKLSCIILFILPFISLRWLLEHTIYKHYLGGRFDKGMSFLNIFRYYFVIIFYLILRKYLDRKNLKEKIIDNSTYIYFFLIGLSMKLGMVHRVAYFFKIFEVIYFLYIYEKINKRLIRVLIIFLFISNYIAIAIKDLGYLKNYRFEKLRLYRDRTNESYNEELRKYLYM